MNKFACAILMVLLTALVVSCSPPTPAPDIDWVKPGDPIGGMTVSQGDPLLPYPLIWQFCDFMASDLKPVESSDDCEVPYLSGLQVQIGWLAKESNLSTNWDSMKWELVVDDHPIDLSSFEWYESNYLAHEENNKDRKWLIDLVNLTPGEHTLRYSWKSDIAVDDGFEVYQPGKYEHEVTFTVLDKAVYPRFSSSAEIGQHPYTSEVTKLDFLFHLPEGYGQDSQEEWPLIVYLHGAALRGANLDLLLNEPLPSYVEEVKDFPFIVVSPLGKGGFEFWGDEEMINSLFDLLAEIQNKYAVDARRIYLTGNDMGGAGVWEIGLHNPEYFAALAPIAGYYNYPFETPDNICDLKDIPIWSFHGERDSIVPVSVAQNLVDALNNCGGNAKITLSPDMKNDVPIKVYANPDVYEWLLSQRRE